MRVIITCGPSFEPIDGVRRLTNFSTGELGLLLAAKLSSDGHEVVCLKGEGAVSQMDAGDAQIIPFSTNEDLLKKLREIGPAGAGAVLHAAALCDYRVKSVYGGDGLPLHALKIPSRAGEVTLKLEPAVKLLPELRGIFPAAKIVGWKYELDGSRGDAMAKAQEQLATCRSDACVVNGAAFGAGFSLVTPSGEVEDVADRAALCIFLRKWLAREK